MEEDLQFAAVPHTDCLMTVTEFVTEAKVMVRQQTKNKKQNAVIALRDIQLTLIITLWTISEITQSRVQLALRFHSFSVDAKRHCIYKELAVALGTRISELRNIQIIPRVAFMDSSSIDVLDVIISERNNINLARVYAHFTGNAAGKSCLWWNECHINSWSCSS